MLFVVCVCGLIDLLMQVFCLKSITRLQMFKNKVYIARLLVWMHSFVSCTHVSLKRITCLHKFTERAIHCMASGFISFVCRSIFSYHYKVELTSRSNKSCMASCLDAQFCFLHTRFVKTYHLSAQVYRTRYTRVRRK